MPEVSVSKLVTLDCLCNQHTENMNLRRWIIWPVKILLQMRWLTLRKGIFFSINSKNHYRNQLKNRSWTSKGFIWSILLMAVGLLYPAVDRSLPWVEFCLGHLPAPLNSSLRTSNWSVQFKQWKRNGRAPVPPRRFSEAEVALQQSEKEGVILWLQSSTALSK